MGNQNERFRWLIKKWVESELHKIENPEIDGLFKKLLKADKRAAVKLLPLFNDKLESFLKERTVL